MIAWPWRLNDRNTMLQNLSEEIRECLHHAEECKRRAKTALSADAIKDYLDMEQRWLALARSYEFAESPSNFTATPFSGRKSAPKE
jgi:hypothetical protein